jgi:chromosome segregation protein
MDKGAHFHCCDFQVHTPRDRNWVGEEASSEAERKQFAERIIGACREKGLDAVAITDHHDLAFVDYIREAASRELDDQGNPVPADKQIVVFPGMELTLAVPCQALIIFDADLPSDLFPLVLNSLAITQAARDQPKCNQTVRLPYTSFDALHEALNRHKYVIGRYIVIPNVSEGGQSTLLRSGHAIHYQEMPCVGGYLDGSVDQLGEGNRGILDGKNSDYGNKPLGLFQTSDNRRSDFENLGISTTWVKWAEPTAEALRQACLARESRLSQVRPTIPAIALASLNVSNSAFMGPLYVEFNSQFNAIIGGRGTGKSTLLEYIRWALCDEPPSITDSEDLPAYQVRRAALIEKTLTSLRANVEVNFAINEVAHTVRRDASTHELTLKIGSGKFESCTEADIRNLLPIQAYSQKQLSSVAVRMDELLRFIHAPIRKELDNISYRLDGLTSEIRSVYDSLQKQRLVEKAIDNEGRELKSLTEQVTTIRHGLKGLGDEDQEILSKYAEYEKEEELVAGWSEDVKRVDVALGNVKELIDTLPEVLPEMDVLPNAAILRKMESEVVTLLGNIGQSIDNTSKLLREFQTGRSSFSRFKAQWQKRHDDFRKAYERAKEKSTTHAATLKQLADLEDRLKVLRHGLALKKAELRDIGKPAKRFSALRDQWGSLHETRSELIQEQCKNLTNISGSRIRATLRKGAVVDEVARRIRVNLTGAKIRGDKIDNVCRVISDAENPVHKYREILDELELLALFDSGDPTMTLPATPLLASSDLTSAELLRIAQKITPESWIDLCLTQLGDKPVFEYQRKEEEYIAFADASAGQQATSLLWALLNQPGPPLIIDQPEDDLDNRMILDIVQQIWKAKQHRQLIFSSHNANVVVNGDADLVICCDYRVAGQQSGGQIKYEGAIDIKDVRSEITKVTEGGPEAFRLRKEKYGF